MTANSNGKSNGKGHRANATSFRAGNPYRWPPGVSGNPKGRPTRHEDLEEVLQEFFNERIKRDQRSVPRLYDLLRDMVKSKAAADHIALLEHAFGKVPQAITVEDVTDKPDAELIAEFTELIHAARARAGADDSGGVTAPPDASSVADSASSSSGTG